MPKSEIIADVLRRVSAETEISKELMLSKCRTAEVTDARHLAVMLMYRLDIYPSGIAGIFGVSPRSIHYVITSFDARIQTNKTLRNSYERLVKQLGNNRETNA